jgi:hypothetical protein
MEAQVGAVGDLDVHFHPYQGGCFQLRLYSFPQGRVHLTYLEQELLEHATLKQAKPRQRSLGLGTQPTGRKAQ